MDQSAYIALTGRTLSTVQAQRLSMVRDVAQEELERMLGWPLNPSDWDNQYIENGKAKEDWACPDVDTSDLDPADEVVGKTRLFKWREGDPYLAIDPATEIHAVKLVNDGVTYHTFTASEWRSQWTNGKVPFVRFLQWQDGRDYWRPRYCGRGCYYHAQSSFQIAVDATWAFQPSEDDRLTLPLDIQKAWADMMYADFNTKRNVRSESIGSHSYTLSAEDNPREVHENRLRAYAGPNGSLKSRVGVV